MINIYWHRCCMYYYCTKAEIAFATVILHVGGLVKS